MFQTLSTSEAADLLKRDSNAAWSYAGAHALVEFLEQAEEEGGGEPFEFDAVAIRCDFAEYASAIEATANMGYQADDDDEADDDAKEAAALRWLENRTTVVPFDGGVIVGSF